MSAKFTTETWRYESGEVTVSGRGCIARIPTPQAGGVFECVANGKLAAAAPELYAELDAMVALFMNRYPVKGLDGVAQIRVDAARAALAKARGEA
jgi:hypothetical protein